VAGTDQDVAEGTLKKYKWSLEVAMDNYLNNPDKYIKEFKKKDSKKSSTALFSKYAGKFFWRRVGGNDYIESEGLLQLYKDLNISMEDSATIVFPYYCNMKNFVEFY
jgi:hypothetical protein